MIYLIDVKTFLLFYFFYTKRVLTFIYFVDVFISSKTNIVIFMLKRKVVPYSIANMGHRVDPGLLAVSPQVTLVIDLVVGCRYFPPGPLLLSQPKRSPP